MQRKKIGYLSAISLNERIKYLKLLFRWQGSIWKLLWGDFLWFIVLYLIVTFVYRFYIIYDPVYKKVFGTMVSYMNKVGALVPLSFLLGFFVSTILGRWWQVVMAIPWMTQASFAFQALIHGKNLKGCRDIRLTLSRYLNLAWILCLYDLSRKVKDKFYVSKKIQKSYCCNLCKKIKNENNDNTSLSINEDCSNESLPKKRCVTVRMRMEVINKYPVIQKFYGGELVKEEEIAVFEKFEQRASNTNYKPNYMVPLMWATRVAEKALKDGYVTSNHHFLKLYKVIDGFRGGLGTLSVYSDFNVPLVYTQVVIIVVYAFLLSEIFSQQVVTRQSPLIISGKPVAMQNSTNTGFKALPLTFEVYFPIYTIIKFLIYMGWFKIGLSLVNPLGAEKSDLPMDMVLDYNLEIAATVGKGEEIFYPDYLGPDVPDEERRVQLENFSETSQPQRKQDLMFESPPPTRIDAFDKGPGRSGDNIDNEHSENIEMTKYPIV